MTLPPKPIPRPDRVSLWRYLRLFRADILSAQPQRLYRAWMAEFRTLFFRSYMINDPALIARVLTEAPDLFPKSNRIREGLAPLLGNSVFVTNGQEWQRQRRIIDPAFEGGRLRDTFPAMLAAGHAAVARLQAGETKIEIEIEAITSHLAADVIFRTLFSLPIEDETAWAVFSEFKTYQRSQPLLNLAAFVPLPKWFPRAHRKKSLASAAKIRALITELTHARAAEIAAGHAPDDLATKIMTTRDPVSGLGFAPDEMVDQVAIFFLAGHETSASALAWGLYMLALHPDIQDQVAAEGAALGGSPSFSDLSKLRVTRDVFRETLRLYPPVPMMVRQNVQTETFRRRLVKRGAQIVLSPWHLHRHERLWANPDAFDPARWQRSETKPSQRDAYMPFSAGPRVCTGAGFAMAEGVLLLALLARAFVFTPIATRPPVPVAHLTVRGRDGIWLQVTPRL
ncbi:MAG: cytochrome P450 [Cypionkella sp.]|nr:cytochrome P450 [Cypionkella sp.]